VGPTGRDQGRGVAKPLRGKRKGRDDVLSMGMNRGVEWVAERRAQPGRGGRSAAKPRKELGEHPQDGGPVNVMEGRYGPYVKWAKINATLPKDVDPSQVTMDMAVALIAEKSAKKGKPRKKAPAKTKKAG